MYFEKVINVQSQRGHFSPPLVWIELKLKLRVFKTGYIVVMVTSDVNKISTICLPMIGNLLDTIFIAKTDRYLYC